MSTFPEFNRDWFWPLGALDYDREIREAYAEEAELLGVMTILWNRQELALRSLFQCLVASKRPAFAEAIWDRQPTHQARRELLSVALRTVRMTRHQAAILGWVLEHTKSVADRRNELIHAEYVVHGRTDKLHARVKSPRSNKPAKHQKATVSDLEQVVTSLSELVQSTEAAIVHFRPRSYRRFLASLKVPEDVAKILDEARKADVAPQIKRRREARQRLAAAGSTRVE